MFNPFTVPCRGLAVSFPFSGGGHRHAPWGLEEAGIQAPGSLPVELELLTVSVRTDKEVTLYEQTRNLKYFSFHWLFENVILKCCVDAAPAVISLYQRGSILRSINCLRRNLCPDTSVAHLDSDSWPFLGMWQFLKPPCSLTLQNNSIAMIRKLVICFFIENHSAPPDVTTYTSEHSIQVERPQGSTTSRTAPKYGNAELMETGDGRSPDNHFSFFINPHF